LIALFVSVGLGTWQYTAAQESIVVNLNFEYVRQGSVGIITLSGPNVAGGVATALGHSYPFLPTSQGFACLLSVPIDTRIKDYPLNITVVKRDGTSARWDGTLKVASGQFILETPFSLPSDKLFLLNDSIQQSEDAKLMSVYGVVTPTKYWQGTFTPPVNGVLSSPFGTFRTYNGMVNRRHTGQDFKAATGTPVLASANGRVVFSRPLDIHGESVIIDHGWGVFTEYSHLSARYVVPGQFVLQGEVLGLSGSTGRSTGPHVHWEIAVNGTWVNPVSFMQTKLPN
jgi:murein DD-endopeptidase MepM/ murein hydrolase activator NlpD